MRERQADDRPVAPADDRRLARSAACPSRPARRTPSARSRRAVRRACCGRGRGCRSRSPGAAAPAPAPGCPSSSSWPARHAAARPARPSRTPRTRSSAVDLGLAARSASAATASAAGSSSVRSGRWRSAEELRGEQHRRDDLHGPSFTMQDAADNGAKRTVIRPFRPFLPFVSRSRKTGRRGRRAANSKIGKEDRDHGAGILLALHSQTYFGQWPRRFPRETGCRNRGHCPRHVRAGAAIHSVRWITLALVTPDGHWAPFSGCALHGNSKSHCP